MGAFISAMLPLLASACTTTLPANQNKALAGGSVSTIDWLSD